MVHTSFGGVYPIKIPDSSTFHDLSEAFLRLLAFITVSKSFKLASNTSLDVTFALG